MAVVELWLDAYGHCTSPMHRWDPRYKLVGLMALIASFSLLRDLRLLPPMLAIAALLYALSRLPLSFLLSRLRYPGIFLLLLALLLPLTSGSTVLLRLGPLALRREGSLDLLLVAARFAAILTTGLVLFGTAPFATTVKAMHALGVPALLTDMALLAYRYLYEVGGDLRRMQRAMRLRGFSARHPDRRTLGSLASLAGSLLVRSYERSDRVYRAMVLRGYGQAGKGKKGPQAGHRHAHRGDVLALAGTLLAAAGLVAAQMASQKGSW